MGTVLAKLKHKLGQFYPNQHLPDTPNFKFKFCHDSNPNEETGHIIFKHLPNTCMNINICMWGWEISKLKTLSQVYWSHICLFSVLYLSLRKKKLVSSELLSWKRLKSQSPYVCKRGRVSVTLYINLGRPKSKFIDQPRQVRTLI